MGLSLGNKGSSLCPYRSTWCMVQVPLYLSRRCIGAWRSLKHKSLGKSIRVRKANPKEKACLFCLVQSSHTFDLLGVDVKVLLFFTLSLLSVKCFIPGSQQLLSAAGYREGFLWKRGRDNGQFLSRKFVLSEREGALKYFNKNDVSFWGCSVWMGDHSCKNICEEVISGPLFNL